MPLTAGAILGGVGAAAKVGAGIGQLIHSKKKPAIRPNFDIQKEYFDNQTLAQSYAQEGLPESTKAYYTTQASRGLSSGIDAALQGGGDVNALTNLVDQYQQGLNKISAEDAQLKLKNIDDLMERNSDLASQKVQQWVLNKYEPFKDQAKANAQERAAGLQNLIGGIGEGAAVLSSYGQAENYEDMVKSFAKNRNKTATASEQPGDLEKQEVYQRTHPPTGNMFADYLAHQQAQDQSNVSVPAGDLSTDDLLNQIVTLIQKRKI
jgi:hypothetical protein